MATVKKKVAPVEGEVSVADALHFEAVADEIMRRPATASAGAITPDAPHIGTLREKRLHAVLKHYLCADESCHERLIEVSDPAAITADGTAVGTAIGRVRHPVADILTGGEIIEVQTGTLYPLRDKIAWYFQNTDYRVTVVHPIPAVKYVSWIDPKSGDILSRNRAPKRGRVKDVAREIYWLSDFVGDPRFSLRIMLLEIEEYRMADGWGRDGKRGSNRYERFPTTLKGDVTLTRPTDYATYFLPDTLREEGKVFTAAEYATAVGLRGRVVYGMLHLLEKLGLVRMTDEMRGRARTYTVVS